MIRDAKEERRITEERFSEAERLLDYYKKCTHSEALSALLLARLLTDSNRLGNEVLNKLNLRLEDENISDDPDADYLIGVLHGLLLSDNT